MFYLRPTTIQTTNDTMCCEWFLVSLGLMLHVSDQSPGQNAFRTRYMRILYIYSICSRPTIWKNAHIHFRRSDNHSNTITINPLNIDSIRVASTNPMYQMRFHVMISSKEFYSDSTTYIHTNIYEHITWK